MPCFFIIMLFNVFQYVLTIHLPSDVPCRNLDVIVSESYMHGLKALNSRFDAISGDVFPSALAENIDCPLLA